MNSTVCSQIKTYALITSILALTSPCFAFDTDAIEEAIESSNVSRVKYLYGKLDREEMKPARHIKLNRDLTAMASDVVQGRTESLSLIGNWRDLARTAGGAVLSSIGAIGFYARYRFRKDIDPFKRKHVTIGSSVLSALGGYLLYRGLTCSTQQSQIDQARNVEKFLKGKMNGNKLTDE